VDEADVNQGLISFTSPIAKALTGKKAGDVIELKGTELITVEEVSFEPMELTRMASDKPAETVPSTERKSQKTIIEQITQPQHIAQDDPVELSVKTDGARKFEPEVNPMEFLPLVNERGNIVGRALHLELHSGNKMLHPVVHLHVLDTKGETTGLYWWHVAFGDTPEKTLKRKMTETLGLAGVNPKLKRQYIREAKTEKELVYVFAAVSEANLPQPPEGRDYIDLFAKD
jgi:hypothetical protein